MAKGLYVIGTDTDVGKTVVSAGLMHLLRKNGYRAAYFKPLASGEVTTGEATGSMDANFVKTVSGFDEPIPKITPFAFKNALAPHLAARIEAKAIDVGVIKARLRDLADRYAWILAEAAGGLAVPLNDDGYMQYDLIRELGFPCLLVARTGLGTINHTLLTLRCAEVLGIKIKGLIMNGEAASPIAADNIATLKKLTGLTAFFTVPAISGLDTESLQAGNLLEIFEENIRIDEIAALMEAI